MSALLILQVTAEVDAVCVVCRDNGIPEKTIFAGEPCAVNTRTSALICADCWNRFCEEESEER